MNAFFASVSVANDQFTYNPRVNEDLEFNRLREARKWDLASPTYKKVRREFLEALVEETGSPMHTFYIIKFPDFDYDIKASPMVEFQRLREFRKWNRRSSGYRRSKVLFQEAFDQEFDSTLDNYFRKYPSFDYNPRNEPKAEFERLRRHMGSRWTKKYKKSEADRIAKEEYTAARDDFFDAFVDVFSYFFGLEGDLGDWKFLCDVMGVSPIPESVEKCKEVLDPYHVNIYNLLDHVQEKVPIIFFPDLQSLSDYSHGENPKEAKLLYPLDSAKGTSLKYLLRRIGRSSRR